MPTKAAVIAFVAMFVSGTAIAASDGATYTLYRNSLVGDGMRLHVASFDSNDGEAYNHENCLLAASLFKRQSGVRVRFWCEKGRFRKH